MNTKNKCILLTVAFIGIIFEELYFLFTCSDDWIIITGGIAILLVLSYFMLDRYFELKHEAENRRLKEQEELLSKVLEVAKSNKDTAELAKIEKFEKAIYLAVQRGTKQMQEQLEQIDLHITNGTEGMLQQIQESSERNAKINARFSRENTKSLMVFQQKVFDNVIKGMEESVRENGELAEDLKNSLVQALQNISITASTNEQIFEEENSVETPVMEESVLTDITEEAPMMEESVLTDITEEAPMMEESVLTDITEEIPVMEESVLTDIIEEAPVMGESVPTDITEEIPVMEESVPTDIIEEEPKVEEVPELLEEPSDPNRMMSPEEIAAMVAGVSEVEEEPKEEEAPADPNRMMTPEEIAALIAGN